MPHTYEPVTPVRVDLTCECGGKMRPTGNSVNTTPVLHLHRCTTKGCPAVATTKGFTYPYVRYVSAAEAAADPEIAKAVKKTGTAK